MKREVCLFAIIPLSRVKATMFGENWLLVTDKPVEVQDFRKVTDHSHWNNL
jgi:hypothetical protein